jgi:hypothetical protein
MSNLKQSLKQLYWKMLADNNIIKDNSREIIEFSKLVKNAKINVVIKDYSVSEQQSSQPSKSEPVGI